MSDGMNMDASSAQENSETKQSSSQRQTSLVQEIEFGSGSLSRATEEKHAVGTENVNKGSTEVPAVEYGCIGFEQSRSVDEDVILNLSCEQLEQQPEDATMNSNPHQLGLLPEEVTGKNLSATRQPVAEKNHVLVPECVTSEALIEERKIGTGNMQNEPDGTVLVESDHLGPEQPGPPSEDVIRNYSWEQMKAPPEDERMSSLHQVGLLLEDEAVNTSLEQLEPLPYYASKNCDLEILEPLPEEAVTKPSKPVGRGRRTSAKSTKEKYAVRSSVGSARVLRSRLQEKSKAPEPSNGLAEHGDGANGEKRRKKGNKGQMNKIPVDEFSRIRTHLRYLLHRISYEQNLIDAYSGEGWKGQSLEKLKPEKELQRAKSEIFRCKLKIRDLSQHLDSLIAQGRLPKYLFDSEGQIDSEDIFCAKCGSKDLSADNDIILCDGACERGFHQFCLEPPLLKEDIPPDDEGWLCPGCNCKIDCIRLLNVSQGTNLSVLDTWEKVFPEAAAAASGNKLDDHFGLQSDDSEDNDYDPDGSELDEKVKGDESSSDESDFYSASEDFGASPNNNQKLELPSDASEDDDYDPNALDLDGQGKQESSSSDFTSDSEDFNVAFDDSRSQCKGEPVFAVSDQTKPCGGFDGEGSKVSQRKKQSLNNELLSLLKLGSGQGDTALVSGKRHVERLDYGKLYDETYGNVSCDSSDEDWTDAADVPKRRRKNNIEEVALASPGGRTPIIEGTNANDMMPNHDESESTPRRRPQTNNLPAKSRNNSAEPGCSYSNKKRSSYRRLGEAVTQGLVKSFKENQYPERATKENMAKEFGITVHQVSKWFENARWSFRHTSRMESSVVGSVPQKGTPPQTNLSEPGTKMMAEVACNGFKNTEPSNMNAVVSMSSSSLIEGYGSQGQGSSTPRNEEREWESDHQASGPNYYSIERTVQKPSESVDLQSAPAVRKRGRPKGSSKSTT